MKKSILHKYKRGHAPPNQRGKLKQKTMYDLIKFEDGKCDFNANGFDCRDCSLKYECEFSEISIYETETETKNNINNGATAPQKF